MINVNKYGVVTDYDTIRIFETKSCLLDVNLIETEYGKWLASHSLRCGDYGSYSPIIFATAKRHETKNEAILFEIAYASKDGNLKDCKEWKRECCRSYERYGQLSLFELE